MLFTTHAVTGATIGILSGNPILAFVFGIISHYILDALPHFDQGSFYMRKDRGPSWAGAKYEDKKKFLGKESKRDWLILGADFLIAVVFGLYFLFSISSNFWLLLILGGLGGLLPDILGASPLWGEQFKATWLGKKMHRVHHFFHWPLSTKYIYLGVLTQIVIIFVALYYISKFF